MRVFNYVRNIAGLRKKLLKSLFSPRFEGLITIVWALEFAELSFINKLEAHGVFDAALTNRSGIGA